MTPEGADVMTDAAQGQKGSATSSRPKWSPWFDGKLAVAASIFGPYDLLVFPMLFYWGGGGAFLLIYLLFVALMAVPLLFLEVGIGQFMDRGAMAVWNIAPLFKGIGYVTTAVSAHVFWIALWMLTVQGLFWVDLGQSYVPSPDLCGTSEGYGTNDSYPPCQYAAVGLYSDRWPDHSLESGTVEGSKVLAMLLMLLLVCGVSAAGVRVV
ncbi:sodium- and chloride-dependent creatine transporter 1-like, partial [Pollicipes pollicipes]